MKENIYIMSNQYTGRRDNRRAIAHISIGESEYLVDFSGIA